MNQPTPSPRPPQEWIDAYVTAGARVILKRALRAADAPFHDLEPTDDLADMARRCCAPVDREADSWSAIALSRPELTDMEAELMEKQARRALEVFRASPQGGI